MTEFEHRTATANAPGYDGSTEMLQQRQAAMNALINGGNTGGTLDSTGANRGGTLDSAGSTMGMEIGRNM